MIQSFTLCWNCKKATGGCSWADKLKPVKGWTAEKYAPTKSKPYVTYTIHDCPEFEMDSYQSGTKRLKK